MSPDPMDDHVWGQIQVTGKQSSKRLCNQCSVTCGHFTQFSIDVQIFAKNYGMFKNVPWYGAISPIVLPVKGSRE